MFELTKSQASSLCKIFRGRLKMPISEPASFGRYSREFVMALAPEGSPCMLKSPVDAEIPWIEPWEQQQIPLSPFDCTDKHVSVQKTCDKSISIDEQLPEVGDVQMWEVADDEHKSERPEEQVDAPGDSRMIDARSEEEASSALGTDKSSVISTSSAVSQGGGESEGGPDANPAYGQDPAYEVVDGEEQVDAPWDSKMIDARSQEEASSAVGTDKSSVISTSSAVSRGGGESDANPAYGQGTEKVEFHNILQKLRRFEAQQSERALERQKALESTQVKNCHPELESLAQIRIQNQRVATLRDVDSMLAKAVTKSVSLCAEAFTEMQQAMCELKSLMEDLKIKCLQADMLRTKEAALLDSATDTSSQLSSLKLDVLELKLKLLSVSYC